MNSVWVVEQGEYSDYRVVGVYSTEANARLIADAINDAGSREFAGVDQWPVDPGVEILRQGLGVWYVRMASDGTVEACNKATDPSDALRIGFDIWPRSKAPAYAGMGVRDAVSARVVAKNRSHAIKIVNEKRAQLLANGEIS